MDHNARRVSWVLPGNGASVVTDAKRVYIVTSGCYSDYSIRGVFLRHQDAKTYCENNPRNGEPWGDFEIEEWDVGCKVDKWTYKIKIKRNGDIHSILQPHETNPKDQFDSSGCLILFIESDTKQRAIKVANERRTRLIALGLWDEAMKKMQDENLRSVYVNWDN